jgi:hypothetical protein
MHRHTLICSSRPSDTLVEGLADIARHVIDTHSEALSLE